MRSTSFRIGYSIASYVLFAILALVAKTTGILSQHLVWGIVLLLSLVLRDVFAFFGLESEPRHSTVSWKLLWSDFRRAPTKQGLSQSSKSATPPESAPKRFETLLAANRLIVFPVVLSVYLLFLFFRETDTFGLGAFIDSFGSVAEYSLLGICVASGILTVFRESVDARYVSTVVSITKTRTFLVGSYALALFSCYVVFGQTASLGWIAFPISFISGLLVFTIGLTLLEESPEEAPSQEEAQLANG